MKQQPSIAGYLKGEHLMGLTDAQLTLYVMGHVDGALMSAVYAGGSACFDFVRVCLARKANDAFMRDVRAYMIANPEESVRPANYVLFRAILGPCADLAKHRTRF